MIQWNQRTHLRKFLTKRRDGTLLERDPRALRLAASENMDAAFVVENHETEMTTISTLTQLN
jgi:hypothetical protein